MGSESKVALRSRNYVDHLNSEFSMPRNRIQVSLKVYKKTLQIVSHETVCFLLECAPYTFKKFVWMLFSNTNSEVESIKDSF
jgi:hypothetical protein